MKRKIIMMMLLIFMLAFPSFAAENRVYDYAGLLTAQECAALEQAISEHSDAYSMDVVLVTIADNQGKTSREYADDFYDRGGFGTGAEKSGVLFLLNMDDREWYISTCGNAITSLSDKNLDQLGNDVAVFLAASDYYRALDKFVQDLPHYYAKENSGINVILSVGIGFVTALVAILIMRGSMNTKNPQRSAADYAKQDSFHLCTRQDIFLYSQVSKIKRQENSSQGNSSVHRSSSGRSHGGRGGKF